MQGGDGSTLSLDFTAMSALDSRFTFTRSTTTSTYINSSGLVASAGTNVPRFDYDPTTLAPRGLLIEGSATNLCRSSNDLRDATYWTLQTAYSATSNTAGPSPDGTNNATSFTEPVSNLQRSIYQTQTAAAGTYTGSIWAKSSSGSTRYIRLVVSSGASDFGYVTVNINTGAIQQAAARAGTATNASASVTTYPSGWVRITLTVTLASSVNFMFAVPTDLASIDTPTANYGRVSYLGDGSVFFLWGAQLEAGSRATSYIPTGASTVQRAADSCTMTGTNFSSWFNATNGTLLTTWSGTGITSGRYATITDGSTSNQIWNGFSESAIYNGSFQASFGAASTTDGKVVMTYAANDAAWCLNNGTVSTDTTVTLPTGLNQITIGNSQAGTAPINTALKTIKFWPTRLPNSTLQSLTA